jgi:hypothetical protein
VGIRKVLGSMKGDLIRQFLAESLLLTALAMALALALVYWALPVFNTLTGQSLVIHWKAMPWVLPSLIVGTTVVYRQLSYMQHEKLGYDRDQVVVVQEVFWLGRNGNSSQLIKTLRY